MLKKYILFIPSIFILCLCYSQPDKKLASAFIQSVAKNNFQLLDPYILDVPTAKSIYGNEFTKMTPAKQATTIKDLRARLMDKWAKVVSNASSGKIDFGKLAVKQVLAGPIEGNELINSLLVTYQYDGKEWDDLFFIVNKKGATKYIIDLPSNTSMFTLNEERRGKNITDIQTAKDRNDPNIKQHLMDELTAIKNLLVSNDEQQLYHHLVYSGEEDKENRWKRTIDASKPEDVRSVNRLIEKLKEGFAKCREINYGAVRTEKESEGVWYVINTTCGTQKHTYAFLKINNVFMLGDVD